MPPDERFIHRVTMGGRTLTLELLDEFGQYCGFLVGDTTPFARLKSACGGDIVYYLHPTSISSREMLAVTGLGQLPTWVRVPIHGAGDAPWPATTTMTKKPGKSRTVDRDAVRPGSRGISFGKI